MRIVALIICLLIVSACSENYPGYKKVDQGLYIKLLAFDDSAAAPDSCFSIEVEVSSSDTALYSLLKVAQPDNLPSWLMRKDERWEKLSLYLTHMQPGDRAVFLVENDHQTAPSEVTIWWKNCYSDSAFRAIYTDWLRNRELREGHRIRLFALDKGYTSSLVQPEVLYRTERSGEGVPLKYGDAVSIRYTGRFLDGQVFDQMSEPLHFTIGTEDQVLRGLEYGLIGVRRGEIRSIVSPSFFAFGERGSAGIVPPFTPVWYQVEVSRLDSLSPE